MDGDFQQISLTNYFDEVAFKRINIQRRSYNSIVLIEHAMHVVPCHHKKEAKATSYEMVSTEVNQNLATQCDLSVEIKDPERHFKRCSEM